MIKELRGTEREVPRNDDISWLEVNWGKESIHVYMSVCERETLWREAKVTLVCIIKGSWQEGKGVRKSGESREWWYNWITKGWERRERREYCRLFRPPSLSLRHVNRKLSFPLPRLLLTKDSVHLWPHSPLRPPPSLSQCPTTIIDWRWCT